MLQDFERSNGKRRKLDLESDFKLGFDTLFPPALVLGKSIPLSHIAAASFPDDYRRAMRNWFNDLKADNRIIEIDGEWFWVKGALGDELAKNEH